MQFKNVFIPYGGYWSTPFCRWQGSFSTLNAIRFAAEMTTRALESRGISSDSFNSIHLGITVPQKHSFYGQTWLTGMIRVPDITGPMIAQACATSARVIASAASELAASNKTNRSILTVTCDRTSNGPHILYPNPLAPGGKADVENWVWDNFGYDPYAKNPMIQTAENVVKEAGITREEQEEIVLLRYKQYNKALENDSSFLRRFMIFPVEVKSGKKVIATVKGDEGVFPTTAEGLAKLKPVLKEGTVTYGAQTHPSDGNCGMILTTQESAQDLSPNRDFEIQILSFGQARSKKGFMPMAPVPAARNALESAKLSVEDVSCTKMHNPFAVNDVYFSQEMGIAPEAINNFGSSLVWGHPQAPTGMRLIIELIEELAMNNGGYGLFTGCSAGDSAAAIVLEVSKE
ncbi:MAG: thiolase family protein [Candidatus Heimdallarchaeota archaeon]|nr:MAG: thiolase family protein [Candidatus Heimdallarchaeota archaeon]